jgi:alginate O-acetyltransferase complex protein AlgI
MLFTSLNFLVFLSVVSVIYYTFPHRLRWVVLLTASLVFYAFTVPAFLEVLGISILLNFLAGIAIDRSDNPLRRKRLMIAGIIMNLLLLAGFRYYQDATGWIQRFLHLSQPGDTVVTTILVPLGISFYTLTGISYLVEVKRRNISAEKHAGYFACYLAFFPKLIQGPVERPQGFLSQLREPHLPDPEGVTTGMRLMLWGYFKKLVVANQLALVVDTINNGKTTWSGPVLILAVVLYAFQLYMDFSGYIDIARGSAKILGFSLSRNFRNPYLSRTVKEFWTRWHITLSTWLRDYIFLPLAYYLSSGMKKKSYAGIKTEKWIYAASISVTFILCGLWHGPQLNYIAWGALFALFLITGSLSEKIKRKIYRETGFVNRKFLFNTFQVLVTFGLVCFTWIFFRAETLPDAFRVINGIVSGWNRTPGFTELVARTGQAGLSLSEAGIIVLLIPCIMTAEFYFLERSFSQGFLRIPAIFRWGVYYLLVLLIFYFGKYESGSFIYFRF